MNEWMNEWMFNDTPAKKNLAIGYLTNGMYIKKVKPNMNIWTIHNVYYYWVHIHLYLGGSYSHCNLIKKTKLHSKCQML